MSNRKKIKNSRVHLRTLEDGVEAIILHDTDDMITCTCGSGHQYPVQWVFELIPTMQQVIADGMLDELDKMTSVIYDEFGGSIDSPVGRFTAYVNQKTGFAIALPAITHPTINDAARTWPKDRMDEFADLMVDAGSYTIARLKGGADWAAA